jgi:hypothetical protein
MWKCSGTATRNGLDTISDMVGKINRKARKPWITQEMINKMEE